MASQDVSSPLPHTNTETTTNQARASAVEDVVGAIAKVSLHDEDVGEKIAEAPRPLKVYSRLQILRLSKSPLVHLPDGMPPFKDWFGDWNEQVGNKKESEASTATNARDRRFRRDVDDGDITRQSFRSGLSQPSQMGNFRHQSIRTTDRTVDKDLDRERERDLRDREGQERLRNLSDKYDRDRLALSSASTIRNKERDAAPHLSGTPTARLGQAQGNGRRGDGRDTPKRKPGESSDDWRRGAEPSKAGRDGTDSRRDRDTRERPRSRVRDTSRSRREPSTARRDRDRDREDRDRPRERRNDGDRDDRRDRDDNGRRDRDDFARREWDDGFDHDRDDHHPRDNRDRYDYNRRARDRDTDRDAENDSRHWRDDGRRDERIAARREREARERGWDRFEERDRERPSAGDDRDTRNRRGQGRERRNDDNKDREDRRERDKDREVEPAWMETYIPSNPGSGILGGKGIDGELDGIQAWKKDMKERERKEKGEASDSGKALDTNGASEPQPTSSTTAATTNTEAALDEIQLFKLMMKREAEKKEGDKFQNGLSNHALAESGPPGLSNSPSLQTQKGEAASPGDPPIVVERTSDAARTLIAPLHESNRSSPRLDANPGILASGLASLDSVRSSEMSSPSLDRSTDAPRAVGLRLGQGSFNVLSTVGLTTLPPVDLSVPSPSTNYFNPPPGSRMLALKSRVSSTNSGMPHGVIPPHAYPIQPDAPALPVHLSDAVSNDMQYAGPRMVPSDTTRVIRSFSPLSNGSQPNVPLEDLRDSGLLGQMNEGLRRASGSSAAERAILGLPGEGGAPYGDLGGSQAGVFPPSSLDPSGSGVPGGVSFATSKGSRFAKFFDQKTRESQAGGPRLAQQVPNLPPAMPHPNQRQDPISPGGMSTPRSERTMEDIFAMLQSSAQGHRGSHMPQSSRISPGVGGQFPPSTLELQLLHQQQQQQQQQQQLQQQHLAQNRLDSLYDSRLDDRNFVPDGLVPGLRPAPPRSRSRGDSGGVLFNEQIDDPLHFNVQRLAQQRNLEQMYNSPISSMYNQQQGGMLRNGGGLPVQQSQFRGPSPITVQNALQAPSQRLPPGLANLGGRPPHDPSQYLGSGVGVPGGMHGASPAQQVYNTLTQSSLGFNGNPQMRGAPGPQNVLSVNQMGGGLGPNSIDLRPPSQAQLLGLAQGNLGGGLRGAGAGFAPQHGGPGGQLSHAAIRQQQQQQQQHQQQQHLPPHMMQHILPSHLQQQGIPGGTAQATQDLMALLMGGHRE